MPKFVEAERGYINLDLVAFMFLKEDGGCVCYSAEGNAIGTLSRRIVEQLLDKPVAEPELKRHLPKRKRLPANFKELLSE